MLARQQKQYCMLALVHAREQLEWVGRVPMGQRTFNLPPTVALMAIGTLALLDWDKVA